MKKLFFILISIAFAATINSCKKDNNGTVVNTSSSYSNKIVLTNIRASSDSVVLTWTKLTNKHFQRYYILRRNYKEANPSSFNYSDILSEVYDASVVKFTDNSVPVTSYLEYQIVGIVYDTVNPENDYIFSNVLSYERSDLKTFTFNPLQVLPDIPNHRMFVIEADSGKIDILDYSTQTLVKSIMTNSTNGYCDLGTYIGIKELYVPRNDGWVYIYNAATMDKIDQFSAGNSCSAVISNNGQLFVFGSSSYYYNTLTVFDRATKTQLSTTSNNLENMRPKLVPGSTTKILGISSDSYSSGDLYSFEFNASGQLLNNNYEYVDYPADYHFFQIFPDGQHFVTSAYGTIFKSDLSYVVQLPYGNYNYADFTFNQGGTRILAGCSNYKKIVAYANPGYTEMQSYPTSGYPVFIFNDNNTIISLSSTTLYNYYGYSYSFIIEKIPISK